MTEKYYVPDAIEAAYLQRYLKHELWFVQDAICLLGNLDPAMTDMIWPEDNFARDSQLAITRFISPDGSGPHNVFDEDGQIDLEFWGSDAHFDLVGLEFELESIRKLWFSQPNVNADRYPPSDFVEWACTKGIEVRWLQWAIESGFYKSLEENKTIDIQQEQTVVSSQELDENNPLWKTKRTLLEIIAALMAAKKLNLEFHSTRTQGAKTFMAAFNGDFQLTSKGPTVTQYMKEALQLLPEKIQAEVRTRNGLDK